MDKRKAGLLIISGVLLLAVLAGTYALVFNWGKSRSTTCAPSSVAALAIKDLKNSEVQANILILDNAFSAQYARVCLELCEQRAQLAKRLGETRSDDPEAVARLNRITADQTQLEMLTWQHILRVRDSLPGAQRAAFVQVVRAQWEQAVSHMQHQAAMAGACSLHGAGAMGTGEEK